MRSAWLLLTLLWGCLHEVQGLTTTETTEKQSQQQNPIDWMRNFTTNKINSTFNTTKLPNVHFKGFTSALTSPKVSKFGYGVVMGYSSGICLKKVSYPSNPRPKSDSYFLDLDLKNCGSCCWRSLLSDSISLISWLSSC
jgi:hypothetical protein